jgi:hypothetical protein
MVQFEVGVEAGSSTLSVLSCSVWRVYEKHGGFLCRISVDRCDAISTNKGHLPTEMLDVLNALP